MDEPRNRVRSVREARGISLRQLAAEADIAPQQLSLVERHLGNCSDSAKIRIASILSLPVGVLFFGESVVDYRSTEPVPV